MISQKELIQIADTFGTPSYVFDIDVLYERLDAIRGILGEDIGILYAMKANPFLVPFFKEKNVRFEVCSPGEFAICEKENVDFDKIVLSGVNKEFKDINYVMDECGGVGVYTVESLRQFQLLNSCAKKRNIKIKILLRVTSGNQFGLDEEDLRNVISNREKFPNVEITGIQCYTGTQKKKIELIEKEIDWLDGLCDALLKDYGFKVNTLEYGPGLPVSYFMPEVLKEDFSMLEGLSKKLDSIRDKYAISLEMGRYVAASCGMFLSRIEDMKINKEQKYCIIDGGINHINYYGQTMAMKFPKIEVIPLELAKEKEFEIDAFAKELTDKLNTLAKGETNWNICGSLCTVGDVVVKNYPLTDLKIGDMLVFYNIGAYSVTEGIYLFLSRDLPNIISYSKENGAVLLRNSEPTYTINSAQEIF